MTNDELLENAFDCINMEEYEQAIHLGELLLKKRYTGGFEVIALAYFEMEEYEVALETLNKGLEIAPGIWRLHQLAGNCHSVLGHSSEAIYSYNKALDCHNADVDSILLNRSIVYKNMKCFKDALRDLQSMSNKYPMYLKKILGILRVYNESGDYTKLIKLFRKKIKAILRNKTVKDDISQSITVADMYSEAAYAFYKIENMNDALQHAHSALCFEHNNQTALNIIRVIKGKKSSNSNLFDINLVGRFTEPAENNCKRYLVNCTAVADTPKSALIMIKNILTIDNKEELEIYNFTTIKESSESLQGVYSISDIITTSDDEFEELLKELFD